MELTKTSSKNAGEEAKSAVVVGAAGTLGREICLELVARGYRLALADNDGERCEAVRREVEAAGGQASSHRLDVTRPDEWVSMRDELTDRWSHLDLLVNAAGCMVAGELSKTDWDQWSKVVQVNLTGTALGCHTFAPWLTGSSQPAHVINVASLAGYLPFPWGSAYAVSKAGVIALSESLHAEWIPRHAYVTVVCPGFFESGLFARGAYADDLAERVTEYIVRRATVSAREVALAAINGMERRQQYVILPARARWLHRLKRLAPAWLARRVSRDAHRLRAGIREGRVE